MCRYIIIFMMITIIPCYICLNINFLNEIPNFYVIPSDLTSDEIFIQQCAHFVCLLLLCVMHVFCFRNIRDTIHYFMAKTLTASDFTVMVSGLDERYSLEDLLFHMRKMVEAPIPKIEVVIPTYSIRRLFKNTDILNEWRTKKLLIENNMFRPEKKCCRKTKDITRAICRKEIEQYEEFESELLGDFSSENKAPVAFVCYRYHEDARVLLDDYSLPFYKEVLEWLKFKRGKESKFNFNNNFLRFKRPSHPSDIIWENLDANQKSRFCSQLETIIGSFLILILAGTVLFLLRNYQKTELSTDEDVTLQNLSTVGISLLPSLLILVLNLALEYFMAFITKFELHTSYTDYRISVARKLIVLMFINTALVPTIVNSYIVQEHEDWFNRGGLCNDIYSIVLINAIFPPLFYFYLGNPRYWIYWFKKERLRKNLANKKARLSQSEANVIFTPTSIDLDERYAQIIKTLYVGLFFTPLVPMSIPLSIVGIILEYMITKYMILRVHPKPKVHNEELALEMSKWMRYGISIYAMGLSFFYFQIDDNDVDNVKWEKVVYFSFIFLGVGLVYLFLPINHFLLRKYIRKFNDLMNNKYGRDNKEFQYRQMRQKFDTDFERENPPTKDESIQRLEDDSNMITRDANVELPDLPRYWSLNSQNMLRNISQYNQQANPMIYGITHNYNPSLDRTFHRSLTSFMRN